ncbi:YciI family protein [Massilia endophytica]|uniref:YciI family protein n=1 Tax=Massilia endophytica TaxID=2899220 RepID=UPI001E2CF949|nr:YciI family protein [Massilia endophytica]UGQ47080.1 YciI family protein [Massilia endophytica]
MKKLCATLLLAATSFMAQAQTAPVYDAELAKSLGGSDQGMRRYVFVILRTGPNKIPAGAERNEMFAGHMANIQRLADEGKLVYAGPLDGVDGARGIFIFAVETIEQARPLVETDPVIIKGEMVAEYHTHFGSAGLMMVNRVHPKIIKPAAK